MLSTPDLNHDFHESLLHDENTSRLLRVFIGLILGGSVAYLAALPFSRDLNLLARGWLLAERGALLGALEPS